MNGTAPSSRGSGRGPWWIGWCHEESPRDRLEPLGCGSSRALWVGETEEERAANRKAELVRISRWEGCQPPTSYDFR